MVPSSTLHRDGCCLHRRERGRYEETQVTVRRSGRVPGAALAVRQIARYARSRPGASRAVLARRHGRALRCGSTLRAWRRCARGGTSPSASVTDIAAAISRLVRPSASSTSTSRSRDVSNASSRRRAARGLTAPASAPCSAGATHLRALQRGVDERAELLGVAGAQPDAVHSHRQRGTRRRVRGPAASSTTTAGRGPQGEKPARRFGDREVGGRPARPRRRDVRAPPG